MNRTASHPSPLTSSATMFEYESDSSQISIIQEEANTIQKRLEDAEARLMALSAKDNSSLKAFKKLSFKQQKVQSCTRRASKQTHSVYHLKQIRKHLQQIQLEVLQRDSGYYQQMYISLAERLEGIKRQSETQIMQLQERVEQQVAIISEHEKQKSLLQSKIGELEARVKTLLSEQQLKMYQFRIDIENQYLVKQEELIRQVQFLQSQLDRKSIETTQVFQDSHLLESEIQRYRGQSAIERQLKIEAINKVRELESQIKLLRSNNERFLQQFNNMSTEHQALAEETVSVCELILFANNVLNRQGSFQLLENVSIVRSTLGQKVAQVRNLLNRLKAKFQDILSDRIPPAELDHNKSNNHNNNQKENHGDKYNLKGNWTSKSIRHYKLPNKISVEKTFNSQNTYLEGSFERLTNQDQLYMMLLCQALTIQQNTLL